VAKKKTKLAKYKVEFHMPYGGGGKHDYAEIIVKGKSGLTDDGAVEKAIKKFAKNGETWYASEVTGVTRI